MKIFLSYPHVDKAVTQQLRDVLFQGGHTVWMDEGLTTGKKWQEELEEEIKRADAMALAITANWLNSPYCQWEFVTAVEHQKKIIPVILTKGNILPTRISQYQYADFSDGFGDVDKVQKFLNELLQLAVELPADGVSGMNKTEYLNQIEQNNSGGININIKGNTSGANVVISGTQTINGNFMINRNTDK